MDEPQKHYARWIVSDQNDYISWCHLYEMPRKGPFTKKVITWGWQWKQGLAANGFEGIWGEERNILKLDYADGCTSI